MVDVDVAVLEAITAITVTRESRIGCVLVVKSGKLEGIFTERDVLMRIVGPDSEAGSMPLSRLMTPNPESLRFTDSIAYALDAMSLGGYRHVPLVDADVRIPSRSRNGISSHARRPCVPASVFSLQLSTVGHRRR